MLLDISLQFFKRANSYWMVQGKVPSNLWIFKNSFKKGPHLHTHTHKSQVHSAKNGTPKSLLYQPNRIVILILKY